MGQEIFLFCRLCRRALGAHPSQLVTGALCSGVKWLDGTEIEIIDSYTFLGTIITRDGSMCKEINRRISSGRLAMIKLEKIMKDRDVTATTKVKIVETMIFPIVTYRSESWTVREKERKRNRCF